MSASTARSRLKSVRLTGVALFFAAALMFGFGYAMIPLYYKICKLLGIDTARSELLAENSVGDGFAAASSRPFRMEFDSNADADVLSMTPSLRIADMNTGTAYSVIYEIGNMTDRTIVGRAVPSYAPAAAGLWLKKLQCFCFNNLTLAAGEVRKEPVVLLLDKGLPEDIEVVSMSYTFHERETGT